MASPTIFQNALNQLNNQPNNDPNPNTPTNSQQRTSLASAVALRVRKTPGAAASKAAKAVSQALQSSSESEKSSGNVSENESESGRSSSSTSPKSSLVPASRKPSPSPTTNNPGKLTPTRSSPPNGYEASPKPTIDLDKTTLGPHTARELLANSGVDTWIDYPVSTSPRLPRAEIQAILRDVGMDLRGARKPVGFVLEWPVSVVVHPRVEFGEVNRVGSGRRSRSSVVMVMVSLSE